jgi:5-methylcytosine-specific restriction endonuclease McrA
VRTVHRTLLLNATFEPLCVVPVRRAVVLVLKGKAEIVTRDAGEVHSARLNLPRPSVIRLVHFVRVPYRSRAPLSRRAVFARDGHRCQYCNRPAENIDHVIPRSRGGEHAWENVVASCRPCNSRKENRLLHETDLRLRRRPVAPRGHWVVTHGAPIEQAWLPFLEPARAGQEPEAELAAS